MALANGVSEFVERQRSLYGKDLVPSRRDAEQQARELLDDRAGTMTEDDALELGRLLNSGSWDGRPMRNRFAPMFQGGAIAKLTADLDRFNAVTAGLWRGSDEEALSALDRIYKDHSTLPSAGRSYPSILMYLRDPERFAVHYSSTDEGLTALVGVELPDRQIGKDGFLAFCAQVRKLRVEYDLAPQEVDAVLASAQRELCTSTSVDTDEVPVVGAGAVRGGDA